MTRLLNRPISMPGKSRDTCMPSRSSPVAWKIAIVSALAATAKSSAPPAWTPSARAIRPRSNGTRRASQNTPGASVAATAHSTSG